jgi:hypothetical protein
MEHTLQWYLTNAADVLQHRLESNIQSSRGDKPNDYLINEAGYIHVGTTMVPVPEIPSYDQLLVKTVQGMRDAVQTIRAKAESEAKMMEQQINDLLMIGHDSAEDHL